MVVGLPPSVFIVWAGNNSPRAPRWSPTCSPSKGAEETTAQVMVMVVSVEVVALAVEKTCRRNTRLFIALMTLIALLVWQDSDV